MAPLLVLIIKLINDLSFFGGLVLLLSAIVQRNADVLQETKRLNRSWNDCFFPKFEYLVARGQLDATFALLCYLECIILLVNRLVVLWICIIVVVLLLVVVVVARVLLLIEVLLLLLLVIWLLLLTVVVASIVLLFIPFVLAHALVIVVIWLISLLL